jgi:AraC family transcriptional regulator
MPALNSAQTKVPAWPPASLERPRRASGHLLVVPAPGGIHEPPRTSFLERTWREAPAEEARESGRIVIRRWKDDDPGIREQASIPDCRFFVLEIALRATAARLLIDGHCVHDDPVGAGFAALTRAGCAATAELRGPCDLLHLFIPRQRLADILDRTCEPAARAAFERPWVAASDPLIERLAWLLVSGAATDPSSSDLYLEAIALAIVSRFVDCSRSGEPRQQGLVKWRLKRVQALIDEQLSESLPLADLARCAGLSRMHFAAQFRAATGMRPHEYLVRKRIQRAQELLLATTMPLVEVALSVGFQTQAHFTTVFRRFLGQTPGKWRQAQRLG